ncbi:MAG TPA: hypothetical protein VF392_08230 [Terracidiphilus sp.]
MPYTRARKKWPDAGRNSGSFGSITSAGQPRIMQFALKLIY